MIPRITAVASCIGFSIWTGIAPGPEPIVMLCISAFGYALLELQSGKEKKPKSENGIQIAENPILPKNPFDCSHSKESRERVVSQMLREAEYLGITAIELHNELRQREGRFAEISNFRKKASGKRVLLEGFVTSVNEWDMIEPAIIAIQLGITKRSEWDNLHGLMMLKLPKELKSRAFALQPDDLISFEGILDLKHDITIESLDFELKGSNQS